MSVNPNLATLMRVIEEVQDRMPEGEYLAAMNALGALHRGLAVPVAVPVAVAQRRPWSVPYTREECAWFLARIECEAAPFVAELKEQNEIIELKVKGAIRNAQKRRKELVQVLKNLSYKRSRYYNGGVV